MLRSVVVEAKPAREPEKRERRFGAVRACAPERLVLADSGELHLFLNGVGTCRRIAGVYPLGAGSLDVLEADVFGRQGGCMRTEGNCRKCKPCDDDAGTA